MRAFIPEKNIPNILNIHIFHMQTKLHKAISCVRTNKMPLEQRFQIKHNPNSLTDLGWLVLTSFFLLKSTFSSNDATAQTCITQREHQLSENTSTLRVDIFERNGRKSNAMRSNTSILTPFNFHFGKSNQFVIKNVELNDTGAN